MQTLSAAEHCQVSFHPCKFKGVSGKGHLLWPPTYVSQLLLLTYMLQQLTVPCHMEHSEWVFYSAVKHSCRFILHLKKHKCSQQPHNPSMFACYSNTGIHIIKPGQVWFSSVCVCVCTWKEELGAGCSCLPQVNIFSPCPLIHGDFLMCLLLSSCQWVTWPKQIIST